MMKKNNYLLLFLLLLNGNLFSQIKYESLKPGDWFDCEMEFENGMPVFRNHWIPDDNTAEFEQLLSMRFTYAGKENDSTYRWNYKILRYRRVMKPTIGKVGIHDIKIFDSWYPSYFHEQSDSIRNTLTGTLTISNHTIVQHKYNFINQVFLARNILTNEKNRRTTKVMMITDYFIANTVKKAVGIMLLTNPPNKYSKWILPNGLPYAFSDNNKQKVYTIPNASFPIPNKAVLNIINNRIDTVKKDNIDHNYLKISLGNRAHVINEDEIPEYIDISSKKTSITFSLKCGTVIHLGKSFLASKVFIEPNDTIDIFLTTDIYNPTIIKGNTNSIWWSSVKGKTNEKEINKAPITEEFKSYLKLLNRANNTTSNLIVKNEIDYLTKSSLPFLYLRSYNYNFFTKQYLHFYFDKKDKIISSMGGNLNLSFKSRISNAQINYKHFYLHYYLYSSLISRHGFFQMEESLYEFKHFIKLCGDTLLRKQIEDRLNGYNSMLPGDTIPFATVLDEHKEEINILPSNKEYALMLINGDNPYDVNFSRLTDSLPDNIKSINCTLNKLSNFHSPYNKVAIPEHSKITNIIVHPFMFDKFKNIINANVASLIVLYNREGKILYSQVVHRRTFIDKHYMKKQKENILHAIEASKSERNENLYNILLNLTIIVFLSISFAFIIYKIRINRLKKHNEQEKMIQQLKLKSIQSQLNPHFLFNALNSIQTLINSNNTQLANRYLIGFSDLLRGVLKNADKPLVPLTDELNLIERYCELEKLRVNFGCNIVVNTQTPAEIIEIPYMLLQPVIENAIKHGVAKMGEKGQLSIEVSEKDSSLYIRIIDNGQGFGDKNLKQLTMKGKGLKITIDKLKSIYTEDAELTISDNTTQTGGVVQIKLKIG